MIAAIDWEPFIYGIPAALVAYWGYRKSQSNDAVAIQSGAASNGRAGTAQAFEGMSGLIDDLQADNLSHRTTIRELTKERDDLTREVARLVRKHGENGPVS